MKVTQIDVTRMWERFWGRGFNPTTINTYIYTRTNERIMAHGLYELSIGYISRDTEIARDLVVDSLQRLNGSGLLCWDNALLYVPAIGEECNFEKFRWRDKMIVRSLSDYGRARSETGGMNQALRRWLVDHMHLIVAIPQEEINDLVAPDVARMVAEARDRELNPTGGVEYGSQGDTHPIEGVLNPTYPPSSLRNPTEHASISTAVDERTNTPPVGFTTPSYPTNGVHDPTHTTPKPDRGSSSIGSSSQSMLDNHFEKGGVGENNTEGRTDQEDSDV